MMRRSLILLPIVFGIIGCKPRTRSEALADWPTPWVTTSVASIDEHGWVAQKGGILQWTNKDGTDGKRWICGNFVQQQQLAPDTPTDAGDRLISFQREGSDKTYAIWQAGGFFYFGEWRISADGPYFHKLGLPHVRREALRIPEAKKLLQDLGKRENKSIDRLKPLQ